MKDFVAFSIIHNDSNAYLKKKKTMSKASKNVRKRMPFDTVQQFFLFLSRKFIIDCSLNFAFLQLPNLGEGAFVCVNVNKVW